MATLLEQAIVKVNINQVLAAEKIAGHTRWTSERKKFAAMQLICQKAGIDVGEIDGLAGPMSQQAFDKFNGVAVPRKEIEIANAPKKPIISKVAGQWPLQSGVTKFYGAVGKNQTSIAAPWPMVLAWNKSQSIKTITLHQKCASSAERAFAKVKQEYSAEQIVSLGLNLFGGSLNVRKMRGGSAWSMHSWGIAIDFDPERNQLKWGRDKARLGKQDAVKFWKAWEDEGWVSLGRAKNYDWMHVQAARV